MSVEDGWAALHLDRPPQVPRTEYSVERHWDLLKAVTGQAVGPDSAPEVMLEVQALFFKKWNYGLRWSTFINRKAFEGGRCTDMGHAEYAAGGTDRRDTVTCPFTTPEECLSFDPLDEYGPVDKAAARRAFEENYRSKCEKFRDGVNMSGVYITLFSGLIDIFGWDMLLTAGGTDMAAFGEVARRYERWITPYFEAFAESDVPVMMSHDDIVWTSGPVFPPAWYREYIFPAYARMWRPVLDAGKRLLFTSDGDYTMFFDDIVTAGAHVLVMEPMSDMALFAEKYGRTHGFVGNADTRVLLSGTRAEIRAEVERCMAIGKDCPGFFMAVGNHIPANTPVANALYYNEVYEELSRR